MARAAAALLALSCCAATAQGPLRVVPEGSQIAFTTRQMGAPVEGRFTRFDARLALDLDRPEAGSLTVTVDMASGGFGLAEIDAELAKPDWFDSKRFPQAVLQSTAIRKADAGRYEVAGRLSLKGRTRDFVVPVTIGRTGAQATASGAFALRRLDWGIGAGDWSDPSLVADEVRVTFRLVLR